MKKALILALVLAICASFVFAQGGSEGKALELSASTGGMAAGSPAGKGMAKFAEKVEEYSNGSIKIQVFYDTTLGNSSSIINGMQQGTVDFGVCGDAYYSGLVPEIQAFELPYMFADINDARSSLAGPAGQYIIDEIAKKGIQPLTFWEIGFRNLTNNKREISTPADLKGVKLRCLPATFQVKAWEAAGAIPVPMDVSELYSSLQQGVVDGQENPLSEIVNQRFYEVQKFISLTEHVYTPMLFSCGGQTWGRLTQEQKDIIMKAAKDAQAEVYKVNDENSAAYLKQIQDAGLKVNANPDKEAFKALMTTAHKLFTDQYGTKVIDLLK
ncbi:MAG: DctP family TRAP transporter solute-binding subunit [Spirochaetales bacterium]|nr:DctP family TRAP transporter solute-binding subunit [Spirochaetales bacterium]